MSLTFRLETPRDALAKAGREFAALQAAVAAQDETRVADCVYNFCVSVYHVKDWLTEGSPPACASSVVEVFIKGTPALLVCRDICNASKHKRIRKYVAVASSVLTSAPTSFFVVTPPAPSLTRITGSPFRVKVKMADGQKYDVLAVGSDALAAWEAFFAKHGL